MAKVLQLVNRPEQFLALLSQGGPSIPVNLLDGPAGEPVIPAPVQGNIFIDPQNVTGSAAPNNPGTASLPFDSYKSLVKIWGSTRPFLTVPTTLQWLSNGSPVVDPVWFEPYINGGSIAVGIMGAAPAVVTTPILAGTTPKSRTLGSNAILSATYNAATAQAMMLQNLSHPSRAWAQRALGANAFQTSQPFVATDGQGVNTAPAEVDTWANGDSVQALSLVQIPIVCFAPRSLDGQNSNNGAFLYQCDVVGQGGGKCRIDGTSGLIHLQEVHFSAQDLVFISPENAQPMIATNCAIDSVGMTLRGQLQIIGGYFQQAGSGAVLDGNVLLDGDVILGGSATLFSRGRDSILGFFANDVGSPLILLGGNCVMGSGALYGGAVLYNNPAGFAEVLLIGNARLVKAGGTWVAKITNPTTVTGVQLNGSRTGMSHTGAAPDVFNGGISTTPAHLDAAAGAAGFGGNAHSMQLGGASTSNSD